MGCARWHVQPGTGTEVELLTVDREAQAAEENLDHRGPGGLVLGELLAGIEAEDGDVEPVTPMDDFGYDGTGLDRHRTCGIVDQCVGHAVIMLHGQSVGSSETTDSRALAWSCTSEGVSTSGSSTRIELLASASSIGHHMNPDLQLPLWFSTPSRLRSW
jgi:hypothetical protein